MADVYFKTKPRYAILDGLRGVAALTVVAFHLFETYNGRIGTQIINHGYLAVDFFFILSGFVIGYAYDDRWDRGMTVGNYFKRRIIRLHPMVIVGTLIGALCFYFGLSAFPDMATDWWKVLIFIALGCLMLPVPPSMDIRGWSEMYPLNGPQWSLFLEYVANFLYAVLIHKFPKWLLTLFVVFSGALLVHFAVTTPMGNLTGGWSLDAQQLRIGFTRLLFPYFGGLLLYRMHKLITVKHAYLWCSLILLIFMALPHIGPEPYFDPATGALVNDCAWINGLYEVLVIIFVFPLVVIVAAGSETKHAFSTKLCNFLGEISYPIYITHYPLIYMQMSWAAEHPYAPVGVHIVVAVSIFVLAIGVAYASLKLYDIPVRKWLKERFLGAPKPTTAA